jgi:hypothetical protein
MSVTVSHVVFALSFASVFLVCYVGSQFLSSVLNNAGYDFFGTVVSHEKNMSSQLIADFMNNQLAQLVAIALTAVTSVVIFWKFSQSEFNTAHVCMRRGEFDVHLQSRRNRCSILRIGRSSRS